MVNGRSVTGYIEWNASQTDYDLYEVRESQLITQLESASRQASIFSMACTQLC